MYSALAKTGVQNPQEILGPLWTISHRNIQIHIIFSVFMYIHGPDSLSFVCVHTYTYVCVCLCVYHLTNYPVFYFL